MLTGNSRPETVAAENQVKLSNLGIPGLEFVTGGGLPQDSVYILTGQPGTYYATFAQQAIYSHLLKKGKAVYYTSETSSTEIEQDTDLYGWNLQRSVEDGSLQFVRLFSPALQALVSLMPRPPNEQALNLSAAGLGNLTRDFLTHLKDERWSILNISYLMNQYSPQEINDLMLFWVNAVHKFGGVHFVLMLQGAHDERQVTFLKNLVDGVLSFKHVDGFQQTEGEVEIQKMRRILPKAKTFRHVVQNDGLVVETTARIG